MRKQLEELLKLAKQLRSTIQVNKVDDVYIQVSTWISVRRSGTTYYSIAFLQGSKKLDVALFEDGQYISNSITVDVEGISDEELDEIILRSKSDIINFIAQLTISSEKRKLDKIKELQDQLQQLQSDVQGS